MTTTLNFVGHLVRSGNIVCRVPVEIDLVYDADNDPLAVAMVLTGGAAEDGAVTWTFARELLDCALDAREPTGDGDVSVHSVPDVVVVCLKNPQERMSAVMHLPLDSVRTFLEETAPDTIGAQQWAATAVDTLIAEFLG